MSKLFLTNIDLNKNSLLNAVIQVLASPPSSPATGQMYYDSVLTALRVWDGSAWINRATDSLLLQGHDSSYHLARANHSGTQLAATISNLNATVIGYTLDTFAAPTNAVNMNSQYLTNVPNPTLSGHAANKAYVDANIQGLSPKPTAMVATTAALAANTYSNGTAGVGATLTATSNGALTVDTYAVAVNDLVLVKNEATGANNGLYTVTAAGGAGAPYVLTRHVDMDQATEFGGALMTVENRGSTNANTLWVCNVANSITVGTTAVTFTQLNSAVTLTQGNGINISGNTISAVAASSGGLSVVSGGIQLDNTIAVRKYAADIGDGSSTSIVVTHNLGTVDVTATLYSKTTPYPEVECDIQNTSINTITLIFSVAPTSAQYRIVIHG